MRGLIHSIIDSPPQQDTNMNICMMNRLRQFGLSVLLLASAQAGVLVAQSATYAGSLDESFPASLAGAVYDLGVTPDDRILAVSANPNGGLGRVLFFHRDGGNATEYAPYRGDVWAARSAGTSVVEVIVRYDPFFSPDDVLAREECDFSFDYLGGTNSGVFSWAGFPGIATTIRTNRLAASVPSLDGIFVYLEPDRMRSFDSDQSIPVTRQGGAPDVRCIAGAANNKAIIGGNFDSADGVICSNLVQFTADGEFDAAFGGPVASRGADGFVAAIAVQSDGHILVGGDFQNVFGIGKSRLVRLSRDGIVDASFNSGLGPNGTVLAIAAMFDGRIVIAGSFTEVSGIPRAHVARLLPNGEVDLTFDPGAGPSTAPTHLALQQNGDVLVGGSFTTFNGEPRGNLVRLHGDGLRFLAVAYAGDGVINLRVNVRPGVPHRFEGSVDLNNWIPILTNVPPITPWELSVTNAPAAQRFYRAVETPGP